MIDGLADKTLSARQINAVIADRCSEDVIPSAPHDELYMRESSLQVLNYCYESKVIEKEDRDLKPHCEIFQPIQKQWKRWC